MGITINGVYQNVFSVNAPLCDTEYTKFGEDFFDSEIVKDTARDCFNSFSVSSDGRTKFSEWKKKKEDEVWYDLREGKKGNFYIVAGDSEGIKFARMADFLTLDYKGYEINVYSWSRNFYYFSFWIDPEGGILRSSDDERSFDFYDELKSDEVGYPREDFSFKSAIDNLVANSDKYQNPIEEEPEDSDDEEE